MARKRLGAKLKSQKRRTIAVLPAPWVFDDGLRPVASPKANRWRVKAKTPKKLTLRHVKTRAEFDLQMSHVVSATGRELLILAVQLVLYRGIVKLLPLPPGYWA